MTFSHPIEIAKDLILDTNVMFLQSLKVHVMGMVSLRVTQHFRDHV
jgi:hypothetical protein